MHPARSLLRGYALAWGRSALQGVVLRASDPGDPVEAAYLDPFAGADHPLPDPPLSVQVLSRLFAGVPEGASRFRALLLEVDPVKVEWVGHSLEAAGLGERHAENEISLVEGEWGPDAPGWEALEGARTGLALLDPPAAARLPLDLPAALLRRTPLDVLLRFPVGELRRLSAHRGSTLADLPPQAKRWLDGLSRLLGDPRHSWVTGWRQRQAGEGEGAAERAVAEGLAERLRAGTGRWVRVFPLHLAGSAAPELLLLASPEPARILLMNEAVHEAREAGLLPWPEEAEGDPVRYPRRGELELFAGGGAGADPRDREVDLSGVARRLAARFAGRTLPYREVLADLLATELWEEDARRALAALRREGRVLYRSLAQPDAEVAFPRAGEARPPGSRSARRRAAEGDLFLSLDDPQD